MHLCCANCGYAAHESRFLGGRKCVFCRGQGVAVSSQTEAYEDPSQVVSGPITDLALRVVSGGLLGGPSGSASSLNPLTAVAETGRQISDLMKVGLVVGGVVTIWFIYEQVKLAQKVVPEAIRAAPHVLPFLI